MVTSSSHTFIELFLIQLLLKSCMSFRLSIFVCIMLIRNIVLLMRINYGAGFHACDTLYCHDSARLAYIRYIKAAVFSLVSASDVTVRFYWRHEVISLHCFLLSPAAAKPYWSTTLRCQCVAIETISYHQVSATLIASYGEYLVALGAVSDCHI